MRRRTNRNGVCVAGFLALMAAKPSLSMGQPVATPPQPVPGSTDAAPTVPPSAPPTSPAAPAPYSPPPVPCAVCPPGYMCYAGGCIPANPVCAPGYWFDGRYCVPQAGAPMTMGPDPAEEAALQARVQNRLRPRLTIDLQGGLGMLAVKDWNDDVTVPTPTAAVLLGYRQNFTPTMGLLIRGGAMLGLAILDYSPSSNTADSGSDATSMVGGLIEAAPFFGPFGRFYVGPSLWAGYVSFGSDTLRAESDSYRYGSATFHLHEGPMYGIGGTGGVVVGAVEQVDITFTGRLDLNPDHKTTLFLMFGVGFHR